MKIRTDFVTNSSSSSFICVSKIDKTDELINYFKEEYGRYGLKLLDTYLVTGEDIKNDYSYNYELFTDFCNDEGIKIVDTDVYLQARFIQWSTEGDTEGDDAWLYQHIPDKYKDEIYESCPD